MVLRCPEARVFIKAQIGGGVVICKRMMLVHRLRLQAFGSRQYISARTSLGKENLCAPQDGSFSVH